MNSLKHVVVPHGRHGGGWVLAGLLTVAVAGCGGGSSDSSQITSTIKTYLAAIANSDGTTACDQLTNGAANQVLQAGASLGAVTCAQAVQDASGNLGGNGKQTLLDAQVINVHVTGSTASADLQGGTQTVQLTKIGGRWLISGGLNP